MAENGYALLARVNDNPYLGPLSKAVVEAFSLEEAGVIPTTHPRISVYCYRRLPGPLSPFAQKLYDTIERVQAMVREEGSR